MRVVQVWISGRVQGVGYRFATQQQALRLGISGWVRNLPDGRVQAVFAGPSDAVEKMLAWCQQGPPAAQVTSVVAEPYLEPVAPGFVIR
ncbi:MAG: acylphosphatase [Gloeomargarita sp. SKYB31]|nr:acylphosphatase [Gloeomargarita sp. SKYB31]